MPPKKRKSRAKRSSKAKLPKRRKNKKRWQRSHIIAFTITSGVALIIGLFYWIDGRVKQRLIDQRDLNLAAVYTDSLTVSPRTKVSTEQFREELLVRGYAEVSHLPKEAGEFQKVGDGLSGITRPFVSASGAVYEQRDFSFPAHDEAIVLEPRILAPLMSGEQRAHRFKTLKEIPLHLQHAVIAIEDERFYDHHGIDLIGIARAMFINLKSLGFVQGGSTITQQLAKNTLFSNKRALSRKILEALAALSIEHRFTKDRILELYLNEVYLGQEGSVAIHGVGAASATFFGKSLEELTLSECALVAGIIQAPSAYAPRKHLDRALERRNSVLRKMEELGFIKSDERQRAELDKPQIVQQKNFERRAPFFVDALRASLGESLDLESSSISGLKVHTGIHFALQECAEKAVSNGAKQLERKRPLEVSLLALDPSSGLVRAWVGGRSYSHNQFDRVSMGVRQAGSTVKPFLYLTALDSTLNHYKVAKPTSILSDEPLSVHLIAQRTWEPENYDRKFRGDVSLRYALEHSLNLPAVYVSQKVGIEAVANTFNRFHLGPQISPVPSIALGAIDTTLQRMTAAYAGLANGGRYISPRLYSAVTDSQERLITQSAFNEQLLASEDAVYVLTHLMRGVIDHGTGHGVRSLGFTRPAAGKTGTSNDARDAWFVGFTPTLAAGVWLGFDDNRKLGLTGGKAAVPIWASFMKCAENWVEDVDFLAPPGVEIRNIDTLTGRLATPQCPPESIIEEAFVSGTEPTSYCPDHATGDEEPPTFDDRGKPRPVRTKPKGFWESLFN